MEDPDDVDPIEANCEVPIDFPDEICGSPLPGVVIIGIFFAATLTLITGLLGFGIWLMLLAYTLGGATAMIISAIVSLHSRGRSTLKSKVEEEEFCSFAKKPAQNSSLAHYETPKAAAFRL
ncbi:hypothetical protein N4R57_17390 [Rhodobacteraceae bacterium D3-12]|nr:hypothetical protein N4R57_17390 [Rhodobacteraceae bacterium D3-12]